MKCWKERSRTEKRGIKKRKKKKKKKLGLLVENEKECERRKDEGTFPFC